MNNLTNAKFIQFIRSLPITSLLWATLVVLLCLLLSNVDAHDWRVQLATLGLWAWLIVPLLQCAFSVCMLPTLPLVIALAWLFPNQPLLVLANAMLGVCLSALMIYRNASVVGLRALMHRHPKLQNLRSWLQRSGAVALSLWCAAPFLPSDVGCYVAASARMPKWHYLTAVCVGELLLCASAIFVVARISA